MQSEKAIKDDSRCLQVTGTTILTAEILKTVKGMDLLKLGYQQLCSRNAKLLEL